MTDLTEDHSGIIVEYLPPVGKIFKQSLTFSLACSTLPYEKTFISMSFGSQKSKRSFLTVMATRIGEENSRTGL